MVWDNKMRSSALPNMCCRRFKTRIRSSRVDAGLNISVAFEVERDSRMVLGGCLVNSGENSEVHVVLCNFKLNVYVRG